MAFEVTYELYIGSHPETNELEIEKIRELLTQRHDTFTVKDIAEGYWGGVDTETAVILLTDIPDYVEETVQFLKESLDYPLVAMMETNDLQFM